jgi:DNA-binding CsgD family transcriptional regulator
LSRLEWFLGLRRDAENDADAAIAELKDLTPGAALARAYAVRAQLHMLASEAAPAIRWSEYALELADRYTAPAVRVSAQNTLGAARMIHGDRTGRALIESSLALAMQYDLEEDVARAWVNLVWTANLHGDREQAEHAIDAGLAFCIERHLESGRVMLLGLRAESRLAAGNWQDARVDAETAVAHAEMPLQLRLPGLIALARLRVRCGHPAAGEVLARTIDLAQTTAEAARLLPLAAIAAEHAFYTDDAALMKTAVVLAEPWTRQAAQPWAQGELAYWRMRSGQPADLAIEPARPWALLLARQAREAALAWSQLGQPYEQALALASGDVPQRRAALLEFDRLGAGPAGSRLRRELRAAGVTNLPRGPRKSTRSNAAGLTRREFEVLWLLEQTLRDAQIARQLHLSVKTVGHHVSAILAKLGAQSRVHAVSIASALGLLQTSPPERRVERRRLPRKNREDRKPR